MTPEELKKLRKSLNLSQMGFADIANTQQQIISKWEKGERPIPPRIARLTKENVNAETR